MSKLQLFLLFCAALVFAGCAGGQVVTYNSTIDSVERPDDAEDRYGEYTITESDTAGYVYEDELIQATFVSSGGSRVLGTLENKTDYSIQVRVEQGAFILPGGSSDRIMLGDMSFANRNQEVQPITIPSGATSTTIFIPQSKVDMDQYGLALSPIISPGEVGGTGRNNPTSADVRENMGTTYSLLLPIQIQDTVNEYTFTFKVTGAKIEGTRETPPETVGEYPSQ